MELLFDGRTRSLDEDVSWNGLILPWVLRGRMGEIYGGGVMWIGSIIWDSLGGESLSEEGKRWRYLRISRSSWNWCILIGGACKVPRLRAVIRSNRLGAV